MGPPASHKISRVSRYSGAVCPLRIFDYRTVTFFGPAFLRCSSNLPLLFDGPQPRESFDPRFGLFPVRSPLLRKSIFLSSPPGT